MHISKFRLGVAVVACTAAAAAGTLLAGYADGSSDHAAAPLVTTAPTVTPRTVAPKGTFTVSGKGCATKNNWTRGVFVTLSRNGADLVTTAADHDDITGGAWTVQLHLPASVRVGSYKILSTCDQYQDTFSYPAVPVTVAVAVAKPTALTLSGPIAPVRFGSSTTLVGHLRTGTQPVKGATLTLLARAATANTFRPVATRTSDRTGTVRAAVRPLVRTVYRWTFAGTPALRSSASVTRTVDVSRVISAKAAHARVTVGGAVQVYGTVSPGTTGLRVQLQRLTGGRWTNAGTATLARQKLPDGTRTLGYVVSMTVKHAATYTLRVGVPAGSGLTASTSPTLRVTARA